MKIDFNTTLEWELPEDTKVGDEFTITARARVTNLGEELVDVSSYGGAETLLPGDQTATVYLRDVEIHAGVTT